MLWGTEEHVRELLGRRTRAFERHEIEWSDESAESYARFMVDSFGRCCSRAREQAATSRLARAYRDFLERENEADDGTLPLPRRVPAVGRRL